MAGKGTKDRDSSHAKKSNNRSINNAQEKNDIRKAKNHAKLLISHTRLSARRKEMVEEACAKLSVSKAKLHRMVGTLNSRRLAHVLDGTYTIRDWYILRLNRETKDGKKKRGSGGDTSPSIPESATERNRHP